MRWKTKSDFTTSGFKTFFSLEISMEKIDFEKFILLKKKRAKKKVKRIWQWKRTETKQYTVQSSPVLYSTVQSSPV